MSILVAQSMEQGFEICELAEPNPASLIESLRAVGYSLPTAIADLVDNSLTAGATRVEITLRWAGENSSFCILDNGQGMDCDQLVQALRPGSSNPMDARDSKDLGRFGLGLKTASFSQCRRLTVHSKIAGETGVRRTWDLDHVGATREWRLISRSDPLVDEYVQSMTLDQAGTAVIWEVCDRIVPAGTSSDDDKAHRKFLQSIDAVVSHLALVFHRFIDGSPSIKIFVNGNQIKAFDPFLQKEKATQQLTEETLRLRGESIVIRPFVLPHHSKLSKDIYEKGGTSRGWTQAQGFYVYRNKRLLVEGDWLVPGLRKDDHYKLARIAIDIPNTLDADWQIDVRKARAKAPLPLIEALQRIAQLTRTEASKVYRHRGARLRNAEAELVLLWNRKLSHGKVSYEINRDHPIVCGALSEGSCSPKTVEVLLRLIEESIPVPTITVDVAEHPDEQRQPFEHVDSKVIVEIGLDLVKAMCKQGLSSPDAVQRLSSLEPFHQLPHIVQSIREDLENE